VPVSSICAFFEHFYDAFINFVSQSSFGKTRISFIHNRHRAFCQQPERPDGFLSCQMAIMSSSSKAQREKGGRRNLKRIYRLRQHCQFGIFRTTFSPISALPILKRSILYLESLPRRF